MLNRYELNQHQQQNLVHTILLLGGMGTILALTTTLLWGLAGMAASFIILGGIVAFSQHVPTEAVMKLYRAAHIPHDNTQLSRLVDELTHRANLPARPDLYLIPSATLNAFATGTPEKSAIAMTEGLMRTLTMRELMGVIAHEISHIRSNDLWVLGIADILSRVVQPMTYVALAITVINLLGSLSGEPPLSWTAVILLYTAPAISSLLQLALSRTREYDADADAIQLTGDPMGLASALRHVDNLTGNVWEDLALPVPARRVPQPSLLRTHPETDDRIEKIFAFSDTEFPQTLDVIEEPMVATVAFGPSELRPRYRFPGLWF